MIFLRTTWFLCLTVLLIALNTNNTISNLKINSVELLGCLMLFGFFPVFMPLVINIKASEFYNKAKQKQTLSDTTKTSVRVEEEYRMDSILLLISQSLLFLYFAYVAYRL